MMDRYNVVTNDRYDMEKASDGMWVLFDDLPLDARLIAAAPDLYSALFELVSSDESVRDATNAELTAMASDPMQTNDLRRLAAAILLGRAAIAKSTKAV